MRHMATNPAIEKVISDILSILEKSTVEKIDPFESPKQLDEETILLETPDAEAEFYSIEPPVYNLFKTVVKRLNGSHLKSIELISYPFDSGNISDIEELSNKLYNTLKDHTVGGLGRFNKGDAYQLSEIKVWPGKLWADYKTNSLITLSMFDGVTKLNIINGTDNSGA